MLAETKTCKKCNKRFEVTGDDRAFYDKMGVPVPGLCPECRFKRRAQFRNEMSLYTRKCDLCSKGIVSVYNPKSLYTVYCSSCWESDRWDPYSYGRGYDSGRSFFEQLGELFREVPKKTLTITEALGPNVNSEYTNVAGSNKNCYMLFNGGPCEDTLYSRGVLQCRDNVDVYFGVNLERCYEVVNAHKSGGIVWGRNVESSLDSSFLLNCVSCQDCFGCVNLRHKNYHFLNEPLPKDEYKKRVGGIVGSYSRMEEFRKKFEEFSLRYPRRENNNLKTVDSAGDYLFESKNLFHCFEVANSEDCKYLFSTKRTKDSYDLIGFGVDGSLLLEGVAVGMSSRVIGSYWVENAHDVEYSFSMKGGEYCVGCDGLRKGKYSILNEKYDKGSFDELRKEIVDSLKREGEYGLYMPSSIAPFGYNETVAHDNMPLSREEALAQGFKWQDELQMTVGKETVRPEDIPDHIRDVQDGIVGEVLKCTGCGRNYKVTVPELTFYRKMVLPIPRKCFFCRHKDRVCRRGPFELYDRECAKCGKDMKTNYAPDRPEIVYCETCYKREVV